MYFNKFHIKIEIDKAARDANGRLLKSNLFKRKLSAAAYLLKNIIESSFSRFLYHKQVAQKNM